MNRPMNGGASLLLILACLATAPGCGSQNDTRPATWSYISAVIIQPGCGTANCHSNLSQRSGVVLDEMSNGYYHLVGRHFVIRNNPDDSALVALLRGEGSRRMPPDFALPKDDIDLISTWIANGAPYDGPGQSPVAATQSLDAGGGN